MNLVKKILIGSIIKDVRNMVFRTITNDPERKNIIKNKLKCDSIDEYMKRTLNHEIVNSKQD